MKNIEIIEKLHPDVIQLFLTSGQCQGIPLEAQLFLKQLQWSAEIYEFERNISRAARQLQLRILAQQNQNLDVRTCKSRIYAAISYFSIDNNVSIRIWESDFADKYEDLAKFAIASNDLKTAKACSDAAIECRRRASEAAEKENAWAPVFLISSEITAEQMGFKNKSLKEIARKSNEGYYINLISSLPIEKDERQRILDDAQITDAEIIETTDD